MTYNETWSPTYATNNGQWDTKGNHFTISSSYMSSNATDAGICIADPPAHFYLAVGAPNTSTPTTGYLDLVDPDGEGCYFAASVPAANASASVFSIDSKGRLADANGVFLAEYTGPGATSNEVFFDTPSLSADTTGTLYNYGTCGVSWSAADQRQEVKCRIGSDDTFFRCPGDEYLVFSAKGKDAIVGCTEVALVAVDAVRK